MSEMIVKGLEARVLGFGKCGSRMCYDFFATSCGYPLSYELRMPSGSRFEVLKERFTSQVRAIWTELFGHHTVPINVNYGFFDSDVENEIARSIAIAEHHNQRTAFAFPGQRYPLGQHESGCDFGIVAEAIAEKEMLPTAIQNDDATFRLWFSSLAGGTGSGSTLAFIRKDRAKTRQASTNHLVVGVLPAETLGTVDDTHFVEAERDQAINAGRFLVRWLAASLKPKERGDGLLLISNTAATFISSNDASKVFLPEALLNTFAARAFFHMAYANSADATSHSDFDRTEMSNAFSGGLLVVGMALLESDGGDETQQRTRARKLIVQALGNPELMTLQGDDRVVGMSIPLRQSELAPLLDAVCARVPITTRPLEFRTPRKVVILCALAETEGFASRKDEIQAVMTNVFDNSDIKVHFMMSRTKYDHLTVILVDLFIRQVQRLIYGYIAHAFTEAPIGHEELGKCLDDWLTHADDVNRTPDLSFLKESEEQSARLLGDRSFQLLQEYPARTIERAELMTAIHGLRTRLQWKRPRAPRPRI